MSGSGAQTGDSGGTNVGDVVETVPGTTIASEQCELNGGARVVDSTNAGMPTFVYAHQPSADETWLCTRVEDTSTGDGFGGELVDRRDPAEIVRYVDDLGWPRIPVLSCRHS